MVSNILILIVFFIVCVLGFAATKPDEFSVTRSLVIHAPAARIFENVNDFHKWNTWSPWAGLDSHVKITFQGSVVGEGASMHWEGNNKVGTGTMTVVESRAPEYIKMRLDFEKPMPGISNVVFSFVPQAQGTYVTWSMTSRSSYVTKVMSIFMNFEKMIGSQYEKGLANLAAITENK
jgi:uncharacterized protein YndB with AHSA1/START domain